MTTESRPNWDHYLMDFAITASKRASCPRASVGCVIVRDNRVIASGYNGAPSGQPACIDVGCEMVEGHCERTVHSEANALMQAALMGHATKGASLVCTHFPCYHCAKLIVTAGIVGVMYQNDYRVDERVERLFLKSGVTCDAYLKN